MSETPKKVRIIVEIVGQPPFETQASIEHRDVVVESDELYRLLEQRPHSSCRVIAGVQVKEATRANQEESR